MADLQKTLIENPFPARMKAIVRRKMANPSIVVREIERRMTI